jgi:Tol biopolymer transport system component
VLDLDHFLPVADNRGKGGSGGAVRKTGRWVAVAVTMGCVAASAWVTVQLIREAREDPAVAAPAATAVAEREQAFVPRLVARPALSPGGRFVAFTSQDTDPVTGVAAGTSQVYCYDRETKKTRLVSVGADGASALQASVNGEVSRGGRVVAFSTAAALIPDDRNGAVDMYVRDLDARTTKRVSVATDGAETPEGGFGTDLSSDGRVATFVTTARLSSSDLDDEADAYRHDLVTGKTQLVSRGQGVLAVPNVEMSDDGRTFAISPSPEDDSLLLLADVDSGLTTPLTADPGGAG